MVYKYQKHHLILQLRSRETFKLLSNFRVLYYINLTSILYYMTIVEQSMDEVRNGWWLTTYVSTVYCEHETNISTLDDEQLPPKGAVPYNQTTSIYMLCSLNPSIEIICFVATGTFCGEMLRPKPCAETKWFQIYWPIGTIQSLSLHASCNSKPYSVPLIFSQHDVSTW